MTGFATDGPCNPVHVAFVLALIPIPPGAGIVTEKASVFPVVSLLRCLFAQSAASAQGLRVTGTGNDPIWLAFIAPNKAEK
jgi:hypothetical protein